MGGQRARLCLWCVLGALAPAQVVGQVGSGALAGNVLDQAGASISGATVTMTAVGTNLSRTVITDSNGGYVVAGLAPGLYRLRVELNGFRPLTREGIRLATGETVRLDVQLEVGAVSEAVTVRPTRRCCAAKRRGWATSWTTGRSWTCRSMAAASSRSPRWYLAWRCLRPPPHRFRASTAAGRAPTSICSTASPCCSPNRVRSRSFPTSTRFRSSRSKPTARRPSSAASTAGW